MLSIQRNLNTNVITKQTEQFKEIIYNDILPCKGIRFYMVPYYAFSRTVFILNSSAFIPDSVQMPAFSVLFTQHSISRWILRLENSWTK